MAQAQELETLLAQAESEWSSGEVRSALGRYDSALALVRSEPSLSSREGVICLGKGFALLHGGGLDDSDGWRWAAAVECLERALSLAEADAGGHVGGAQAAFVGQLLGEARARHEQEQRQQAVAASPAAALGERPPAPPAPSDGGGTVASATEEIARRGFVLALTRLTLHWVFRFVME